MKRVVDGLLYVLLFAVAAAGLLGMTHFIVQDKERVELEAEERRMAEAGNADVNGEDAGNAQNPENIRIVSVKTLPVYQKKKITKVKADSGLEMLSYGDEVTALEEDGLYTKVRTPNKGIGYVWSDCIVRQEDRDVQAAEPLKVVVIDVKPAGQSGASQEKEAVRDEREQDPSDETGQTGDEGTPDETGQAGDEGTPDETGQTGDEGTPDETGQSKGGQVNVEQLCVSIAGKLEKRLEASGYAAVMTGRAGEDAISDAKRAELANQIEADAVIQLCMESSEDSAAGGVLAYCSTKDSPHPVADCYPESRKIGKTVLKYYAETTGIDSEGIVESSVYTGINLSTRPVVILNLGNPSNERLFLKMQKSKFQTKMVKGIADGVDAYFHNTDGSS